MPVVNLGSDKRFTSILFLKVKSNNYQGTHKAYKKVIQYLKKTIIIIVGISNCLVLQKE